MKKNLLQFKIVKKSSLNRMSILIDQQNKAIEDATYFIKEIENGNLNAEYKGGSSEDNALSASLISMRNQMREIAKNEKERNWTTEGLAQFVDILRSSNESLKVASEHILSNLIKYMGLNQGALFLLNDNNENNKYLELYACYAYDRKKFLEKRVAIGEGLTGQVFLEKETVYMTDIPENYISITSGLGKANPRNILIVPLKINEEVYGVMELASFEKIPQYRINFVEKLGESIASTLSTVKINHKTKLLLEESQIQAETMKSQEEEMRQNMEELSATQEEMHRVMKEVQSKEAFMVDLLNATNDTIVAIDKDYNIVLCNKSTADSYAGSGLKIEKGVNVLALVAPEKKSEYKGYYDRALKGEHFEVTEEYEFGEQKVYFSLAFSPMRNDKGEITGIASFGKNITQMVLSKLELEQALDVSHQQRLEMKDQEEELRQNMEELSATQEEMNRMMKEVEKREIFMTNLVNATDDTVIVVDKDYKIITCNKKTIETCKAAGMEVGTGVEVFNLFPPDQKEKYKQYYDRIFSGESFEITEHYQFGEHEQYYTLAYSPVKDETGEIIGAAVFGKDTTANVVSKMKLEEAYKKAQQQAEELKAQEEELRQSIEELSTIQEDMDRVLKEVRSKESFLTNLIDATSDSILTIDTSYKVITCNKSVKDSHKKLGFEIDKGFDIMQVFKGDQKRTYKQYYDRSFKGESFEVIEKYRMGSVEQKLSISYSPLKDDEGKIIGAAIFSKEVR